MECTGTVKHACTLFKTTWVVVELDKEGLYGDKAGIKSNIITKYNIGIILV